jgi:RND family efflux transporter MFP subunit
VSKIKTWIAQLQTKGMRLACATWVFAKSRLQPIRFVTIKTWLIQNKWRIVIAIVLIYASFKAFDYFFPSVDKKGGPQTVTSMVVEKKDIPIIIEATGTIVSAGIVDIRPMVSSTVSKIMIKEGQDVKADQVLFILDDRNDRANYEKLKIVAIDAQRQFIRAKELVAKGFISKAGLDTAEANAISTQAAADAAQTQLSYNTIRSPIAGRTGIINIFPGSLVSPGNIVSTSTSSTATTALGAMVTITQLDPINVQFIVAEKEIPLLLQDQNTDLAVKVTVGDTQVNAYDGKVTVIDNQVDPTIGSVRIKAQIPNPKKNLLPGQFARVKLQANTLKDALVVPSQAIVINRNGRFVYVVGEENKVSLKPIKINYEYQGSAAITGIEAGDRVVVEGKQNLRPGGKIRESKAAAGAKPAEKPAEKSPAATDKK